MNFKKLNSWKVKRLFALLAAAMFFVFGLVMWGDSYKEVSQHGGPKLLIPLILIFIAGISWIPIAGEGGVMAFGAFTICSFLLCYSLIYHKRIRTHESKLKEFIGPIIPFAELHKVAIKNSKMAVFLFKIFFLLIFLIGVVAIFSKFKA